MVAMVPGDIIIILRCDLLNGAGWHVTMTTRTPGPPVWRFKKQKKKKKKKRKEKKRKEKRAKFSFISTSIHESWTWEVKGGQRVATYNPRDAAPSNRAGDRRSTKGHCLEQRVPHQVNDNGHPRQLREGGEGRQRDLG